MKKLAAAVILLAVLAMVGWGLARPWREQAKWKELIGVTSDAPPIKRTIQIAGDDWLGYLVARSPEFQRRLAMQGIEARYVLEPDFGKRLDMVRDGAAEFAFITLDSYLVNGGARNWPGTIIFVIDESFGGDAVIGNAQVKSLDDLNAPEIRGAFTGQSPSEFFLRAEISHFKLNVLKKRLDAMRTGSVDEAYQALATGKTQFAVLWEPLVSQALREIPGAHVLVDTRHAQGLVIDIGLASRKVLAEEPALVETVTRAYFATIHEYLNHPEKLQAAAARDTGKSAEDAARMLQGIKFATLPENAEGWLNDAQTLDPRLTESALSIQKILADHGIAVSLPQGDPRSIIFRGTLAALAQNRGDIPEVNAPVQRATGLYPPLTPAQWDKLAQSVRGTLLDEPITFRAGSADIPEEFQDALRDAVPKLNHYPDYRIIVEAHVSPSADQAADLALSEERAIAVKRFLIWQCGVTEERILTRGAGGLQPPPRLPGESDAAWERRARRAKIILVGE